MSSPTARGFSLVEVLVALLITGMVLVAVFTNLESTRRAVDAIHNIVETESVGPRILDQLREDLDHLAVYDADEYRVLHGESDHLGGADADRLDMIVLARTRLPFRHPLFERQLHPPLAEVGYRLRENPERPELMELHRREDALVDEEPWRDGSFAMLYDRVLNFDLRYLEQPALDPVWEDSWDSEQRESLPFAVEVLLEIEVQPRRSSESLAILGTNRARLDFTDLLVLEPEQRWLFRQRLHPTVPTTGGGAGAASGGGAEEGPGRGTGGAPDGAADTTGTTGYGGGMGGLGPR